jgi:hypothetical protein
MFEKKKPIGLFVFFIYLSVMVFAFDIKKEREIYIKSDKKSFIQQPFSFIISNKEDVYIVDYKAADIKIYDSKGNKINIFGRMGVGPNEFVKPNVISYFNDNIIIYDIMLGARLYKIKRDKLELYGQYRFLPGMLLVMNVRFINEKRLLFSGIIPRIKNKKKVFYTLCEYDMEKSKTKFILPGIIDYGVKTTEEFTKRFAKYINEISPMSYIDNTKDYIFYIKAVDLNLIRINRKNGKIAVFKKESRYFKISSRILHQLKKANEKRDRFLIDEALKKIPLVMSLFITSNNKIMIIYSVYDKKRSRQNLYYRLCDINGKIIKESLFYKAGSEYKSDLLSYYNKKNRSLYILDSETLKNSDLKYKISKFKMIDK